MRRNSRFDTISTRQYLRLPSAPTTPDDEALVHVPVTRTARIQSNIPENVDLASTTSNRTYGNDIPSPRDVNHPPAQFTMFLESVFLCFFLKLAASAPNYGGTVSPSCRPIPGDTDWPSARLWSSLNDTVDGHLIATVPLASVCHTGPPFNNYNEESCAALRTAWTNDQTL